MKSYRQSPEIYIYTQIQLDTAVFGLSPASIIKTRQMVSAGKQNAESVKINIKNVMKGNVKKKHQNYENKYRDWFTHQHLQRLNGYLDLH